MLASIVVTTRNRKADVMRALASCFGQICVTVEVLVFDDASTDGTADAVEACYPQARCFKGEECKGLIVRRNQGFREARGKYIFSLDDDAYYTDPEIIRKVVEQLEESPEAAAVAMPYLESGSKVSPRHRTPSAGEDLRTYVGCADALRRDAALGVGGYREFLVHQGEERDLCIRLIDAGFRIAYADCPPIVHKPSPTRDRRRMNYYGIRNTLLFNWLNVPWRYLVPRMAADVIKLYLYKLSMGNCLQKAAYLSAGFVACARYFRQRRPVSLTAYRRFMSLPRHGPEPWKSELDVPVFCTGHNTVDI